MVFSSRAFLFYFLPIAFLGFLALSAAGLRRPRLVWLVLASCVFYAWLRPENLPLLFGSILFNYVVGGQLMKRPDRGLLVFGLAVNIGLLAYYKYAIFAVSVASTLFDADWGAPNIILPLAISFFTFKQIAYLVDANHGEVTDHNFLNYCLFITFFPQLISGPITHHREMLTQFNDPDRVRPRADLIAIGTTIFVVGLFKKVMIADPFGAYTAPVFEAAQHAPLQLVEAWGGAVAYALQIYFDFSGYCDMAVGLGLMFGIALPLNFYSPYKARNIVDYWSRWHITLTRFLTAYIYNPISTALTRRRMGRGQPIMSRGVMQPSAFVRLVAFPTIVTMMVSGVWHGAGWQFVVFGLLHGFYIVTVQGWRRYKKIKGLPLDGDGKLRVGFSVLLTFVCATVALVFFRAADVSSALNIVSGMTGLNGITLPEPFGAISSIKEVSAALGIPIGPVALVDPYLGAMIAFFLFVVWAFPNVYEWLQEHPTALRVEVKQRNSLGRFSSLIVWQPRLVTGLVVGVIGALTVLRSSSAVPTEFIYGQF